MADSPSSSQDEINRQQTLLATYRRTLAHLIQQAAQHGGEAFAPVSISNGIHEARISIQHIKAALRAHGASVNDLAGDEPPEAQLPASSMQAPPSAAMGQRIDKHGDSTTGDGDDAEGNIDQRRGAFISGGTIYGPVVGHNAGTITTTYGSSLAGASSSGQLNQALERVQQAALHAEQRDDDDLAEDLGAVVRLLQAVLRAQHEGKTNRRAVKLRDSQAALREVAKGHPELDELARIIGGIQ
jgi:hypothetical protein